jgi:hypothetical protein
MFCPNAKGAELRECFVTQVGHAKKMNPRLAEKIANNV